MKEIKPELKIYCLPNPALYTDLRAILSDKYCHSLPFDLSFTTQLTEANVVVWSGVLSVKMKRILPELVQALRQNKVMLLIEESSTLMERNPIVQTIDHSDWPTIKLNGWTLLPEDILPALEQCFQKITNV